jgi:hypothetical protein
MITDIKKIEQEAEKLRERIIDYYTELNQAENARLLEEFGKKIGQVIYDNGFGRESFFVISDVSDVAGCVNGREITIDGNVIRIVYVSQKPHAGWKLATKKQLTKLAKLMKEATKGFGL